MDGSPFNERAEAGCSFCGALASGHDRCSCRRCGSEGTPSPTHDRIRFALDRDSPPLDRDSDATDRDSDAVDRDPSALDRDSDAVDRDPSALDRDNEGHDSIRFAIGRDREAHGRFLSALLRDPDPLKRRSDAHDRVRCAPNRPSEARWRLSSATKRDPEARGRASSTDCPPQPRASSLPGHAKREERGLRRGASATTRWQKLPGPAPTRPRWSMESRPGPGPRWRSPWRSMRLRTRSR